MGRDAMIAGFGFRTGATEASLEDALKQAAGGLHVAAFATPADKASHAGLQALARRHRVTVRSVPGPELAFQQTPTQSAISHAMRGLGSVAEASALAAAGPGARLLRARSVSADRMATCAIAEGPKA